ncbi:DUF421 domain-containing protein [Micromonospora sp. CPCC 206061]|uniref:DUF421 domain-containing protein n=1 Tax=Micromonospora sp. CPCC 206061 TaxID=3122410 RepID=UPI002FF0FD3E
MLFQSWSDLARVVIVGALVYPALIAVLRLSGKRTLAKMNAFDLVVTVALGSTLATILLSADVSLVEGVAALVLLVLLQFAATWLSVRFGGFRTTIKSTPTLLLRDGQLRPGALRAQRVTEGEVRQAVRSQGIGDLAHVAAVVLETDGQLSVIPHGAAGALTALRGVDGFEPK